MYYNLTLERCTYPGWRGELTNNYVGLAIICISLKSQHLCIVPIYVVSNTYNICATAYSHGRLQPGTQGVNFKKWHCFDSNNTLYVTWHRKRGDFDIFQLSSFLLSFSSLDIK